MIKKGKQMKRTTKITLIVWAWLLFLAVAPARALYDPGTQRWLNRDPLGEAGFENLADQLPDPAGGGPNLYRFLRNAPVARHDALGLADMEPRDDWRPDCEHHCLRWGPPAWEEAGYDSVNACIRHTLSVVRGDLPWPNPYYTIVRILQNIAAIIGCGMRECEERINPTGPTVPPPFVPPPIWSPGGSP